MTPLQQTVPDLCGWSELAGHWPEFPALHGKHSTDWLVIGAGYTGLAAARQLAELAPQKRIILIDAKRAAQGASARNSGFVVAYESPGHAQLHTARGKKSYQARQQIDRAGVAELKSLINQYQIDCQWDETGSIHAASDLRNVQKMYLHRQAFSDMGIAATLLDADALQDRLGTQHYKIGVYCEGGALVQPAALGLGLIRSLPEQVELYEHTPVISLQASSNGVSVQLEQGEIHATKIIIAMNAFMPRLGLQTHRVFPLALTASLTRPLSADEEQQINQAKPWGVLSAHSLGATVRLTPDRRLLIRNTAEYRPAGIPAEQLPAKRAFHLRGLQRRFPWLPDDAIEYSWSGQIAISGNSRPVFGEIQKRIYSAGCYNASGVAKGTIMGKLIVDHALGNSSELLNTAKTIATPSWIPGPKLFYPIVKARMAYERAQGNSET